MTRKGGAPSRAELRRFGLALGALLLLLAGLSWRKGGRAAPYEAAASAASLLLAAARPEALAAVFVPWMRVARLIARVNTAIVLAVVYYALLSPCAAAARLLGWDPLDEAWGPDGRESYWRPKEADANEPACVERQF